MTIISKAAGGLSLASCIHDMHKCAVIESRRNYKKASANNYLANELNSMRTDCFSYKNSQIKNWSAKQNILQPVCESWGIFTGYIKGFFTAGIKYIPNFIAAGIAIGCSKNKTLANVAAGVLGVMEGWNFIKNTSGINQRNDYLEL